mgnify:CR=1 FL=1
MNPNLCEQGYVKPAKTEEKPWGPDAHEPPCAYGRYPEIKNCICPKPKMEEKTIWDEASAVYHLNKHEKESSVGIQRIVDLLAKRCADCRDAKPTPLNEGWEEEFDIIMGSYVDRPVMLNHLKSFIRTEIAKAKQEGYEEGKDAAYVAMTNTASEALEKARQEGANRQWDIDRMTISRECLNMDSLSTVLSALDSVRPNKE